VSEHTQPCDCAWCRFERDPGVTDAMVDAGLTAYTHGLGDEAKAKAHVRAILEAACADWIHPDVYADAREQIKDLLAEQTEHRRELERVTAALDDLWRQLRPEPKMSGDYVALVSRIPAELVGRIFAGGARTACPECEGRGEVAATAGRPEDGPMPCPTCGGARAAQEDA
jgi:hypothetical protein